MPIALATVPLRMFSRSPSRANWMLWVTGPAMATHTVPAATPSDESGPATPVVAIAQVVLKVFSAPWAIAKATSSLYTVLVLISSAETSK